jgi:hypothetical protein
MTTATATTRARNAIASRAQGNFSFFLLFYTLLTNYLQMEPLPPFLPLPRQCTGCNAHGKEPKQRLGLFFSFFHNLLTILFLFLGFDKL